MNSLRPWRRATLATAVLSALCFAGTRPAAPSPAAPSGQDAATPAAASYGAVDADSMIDSPNIVTGISAPTDYNKSKVSFVLPGVVREVMVKEGDVVQKGAVLMTQDSDIDEAQLAALQSDAKTMVDIDAAKKEFETKSTKYNNLKSAEAGSVNGIELEDAKLDAELAQLKIAQAEQQHEKKGLDAAAQEKRVEKMKLLSPIGGIVQRINATAGEIIDPNKEAEEGAVVIINNDPVWIAVRLPSSQAAKLQLHDKLDVSYIDEPGKWRQAEVVFLDPTVDPGSDIRVVRLQLPNPDNKPSGLHLRVKLPAKVVGDGSAPSARANP